MVAVAELSEEEFYLLAILMDESGIDLAEFAFLDASTSHGRYRTRDYQWGWFSDQSTFQIDLSGRAVGKTESITLKACGFVYSYPEQDMLITAPELNHLRPLTDAIEARLNGCKLLRDMRPAGKSDGITRQPQWQVKFLNGAQIISRLPNKDGKGVKGQHVVKLEIDEGQDFPHAGYVEIVEVLNRGDRGAQWRIHGVTRGVRDDFYDYAHNPEWTVHRKMGMMRPTWSPPERAEKIQAYGGSRLNSDYKRNVYGEPGDSTSHLFVLARLMAVVDLNDGSEYNTDVYTKIKIEFEELESRAAGIDQPDWSALAIEALDPRLNGLHKQTWSLAPKGYSAFFAGMDVGATIDPTEILIFGQRRGVQKEQLDLLLRVQLLRIALEDQEAIVDYLLQWFGPALGTFGVDRTGLGFDIYQRLHRNHGDRIRGFNFSENVTIGFEDREMEPNEKLEDLAIKRNFIEYASDSLREVVDGKGFLLPNDSELLKEFQGETYTVARASGKGPYGTRKQYGGGASLHTLDAARTMIGGKRLREIDQRLADQIQQPVIDTFMGSFY